MKESKETSSTTSNEHQDTSKQVEVKKPLKTTDNVEQVQVNSDFDNMVDDAVKTKDRIKQEEQAQVNNSPSNLTYSPEKAAELALKGLYGALGLTTKFSGVEIRLTQEVQMIFAAMATPLVMKHGKTIESLLNPKNVDLNSNVPEYLAVGAVAVVGIPAYLQIKEVKKQQKAAQAKQQISDQSEDKVNQDKTETSEAIHGD